MKKNIGYLGLLGIPLALLGVVTSVAFAAPKAAPAAAPVVARMPTQTVQAADTDTETNDDASGPQEAPGTEKAD